MDSMNPIPAPSTQPPPRLESYSAGARPAPGHAPNHSEASEARADRLELSEAARSLASQPVPIREDLVARVRDQIARGVYDSDAKLDRALTELAKDLSPLTNLYG